MATVEDILMSKGPDVIIASPQTTVLEASKMMAEGNVGSVIIKTDESPLGIFTERDLLKRVVAKGKDPAETPLGDVMTSPVKSVSLRTSVRDCSEQITAEHIRHLAVVEEGALVGMISFRDVLVAEVKEQEARNQAMRA
jgi:CBS domain-containing protein